MKLDWRILEQSLDASPPIVIAWPPYAPHTLSLRPGACLPDPSFLKRQTSHTETLIEEAVVAA